MAIVKSFGYTDTPISGVTSLTFNRGLLNFEEDFREKASTPGREVVLTNIRAPRDQEERIRIGYSDVANVYSGSNIEPSLYAPSRRGVSILAQITDVLKVSDTTDPDFQVYYPVSCHTVLKAPISAYLTADDIFMLLGRNLSCLFDTGVSTTTRLEAILRGSLLPKGL